jgi:hypothetical protein
LAALENGSASEIDKTSFWWTGLCAICHAGGGPSEFDRDGDLYYDVTTGLMGYETRGETADAQEFDGDYSEVSNQTGLEIHPTPWDVTGVLEPDCMYCHRTERTISGASNMNWVWRAATLRGKQGLTDVSGGGGTSVAAFAAAPTAAQGWFSGFGTAAGVSPPKATHLVIDYSVGVTDGSLLLQADNTLMIAPASVSGKAPDYSCWGCHTGADQKKRGRTWFDADNDVHFAAFNNLNDDDSGNDISDNDSTACAVCHPTTGTPQNSEEHNFAKGNANLASARNDTDFYGLDSCRDCHVDGAHPDAPLPRTLIHSEGHIASMSCQFCHIPLKRTPASLSIDNATTGSTLNYNTNIFLTTNPQDPTDGTTDWWYPSAGRRLDGDGIVRLFPDKLLLSTYWGDWNDVTGDGPSHDDMISAIYLWKVRDVISSVGLTATDDNGDGSPEVNTLEEIFAYLTAIEISADVHGNPFVADQAVLVKGGHVWYLDPVEPSGVNSFEIHGSHVEVEATHPFSIDHNVLPLSQGVTLGATSCGECHRTYNSGIDTPVFDRVILYDAFDTTGESTPGAGDGAEPVFTTLREVCDVDPW